MERTARRAAVVAALAVALAVAVTGAGAAPAGAAPGTQALVQATTSVPTSSWGVVVDAGPLPAPGPRPALTYSGLLTYYAVLTDIGTVQPGSMTLRSGGGTLLTGVEACTTRWTTLGLCPAPATRVTLPVGTRITDPALVPAPGASWWLKFTTLVTVGGTLSVETTGPVGRTRDT